MAKSPDAFRTISEVADVLDTPAHVLRFWESKFAQVKPVKRAGGRRYYRPDDMALLGGIKSLLHDQGMTIKGAQKVLREQGVKHVMSLGASVFDDTAADEPIDIVANTMPEVAVETVIPTSAPDENNISYLHPVVTDTADNTSVEDEAKQDSPPAPVSNDQQDAQPQQQPPTSTPVRSGGALAALLYADPADIAAQAHAIAPLVERLKKIQTRLRNTA